MDWLFAGGRNTKLKPISPRAIMSLWAAGSCNLSHSYLIPQEFPAGLMCYWFQVSYYWTREGYDGERDGLQGVRARDWKRRGGRWRVENRVQWLNQWVSLGNMIIFHLYSPSYRSNIRLILCWIKTEDILHESSKSTFRLRQEMCCILFIVH